MTTLARLEAFVPRTTAVVFQPKAGDDDRYRHISGVPQRFRYATLKRPGSEQELLAPVVEASAELRTPETVLTADAGYHSEANLKQLAEAKVPAFIPDNGYRQRDERYAGQEAHKAKPDPLHDKRPQAKKKSGWFQVGDFKIDPEKKTCICPAGKSLYGSGANCNIQGRLAIKYEGAKRDCGPCALRAQCLRKPDKTPARQVAYFFGKADGQVSHCEQMRHRIDSDQGKRMILETAVER